MKYYHATKADLDIGFSVKSDRENHFYVTASKKMDEYKPDYAPSRTTALFTSDNAVFAVYFLKTQGVGFDEIKLYEVKPNMPFKAPFSITHEVDKRLSNNLSYEKLIGEYWSSTINWNFYEYLTDSFDVVKKIQLPEFDELFLQLDYYEEKKLVDSFC